MLKLIARAAPPSATRLTAAAQDLREAYLARVLSDVASPRKGYFRHGNAMFAKDFAVCRGRLLPCGVELFDPHGGIPRRLFLRGGPAQTLAMLRLRARAGGWAPFWELHFDRRQIREFDAAGYARLYGRLADLLARNPQVRGVTSASWWHDPCLARVSPELSFIDEHPLRAGATLLHVGEDAVATADATRFAPARAALHRQGRYRPCVYLLAWPRRDLLAWARAYREGGTAQSSLPGAR